MLAREASVRQVADVNYGDIETCRDLNAHITNSVRSLPVGDDLVNKVRRRAQFLGEQASYRMETDTVPVAGSFAEIQFELDDTSGPDRPEFGSGQCARGRVLGYLYSIAELTLSFPAHSSRSAPRFLCPLSTPRSAMTWVAWLSRTSG